MSDDHNQPTTSKKKDKDGDSKEHGEKSLVNDSGSDSDTRESENTKMDNLLKFFASRFSLSKDNEVPVEKANNELTMEGLIDHWQNKGFKNIITMVGAGISTSAGIPDFRSPGSGLYDNLQKYNLPHPTAIFELNYFRDKPQPFFALAKELYPGTFKPTLSHYFVRLLHEKGILLRHYTQNIDTLERIAGIPDDKLVEAHGTFYSSHCIGCKKLFSLEWMKQEIFSDHVPTCDKCNAIVKPDIVFFGENLPDRFYRLPGKDFAKCDLLIIMGTSLEVQPFASLVNHARSDCVRLLINRTKVGAETSFSSWFMPDEPLLFDGSRRDVAFIGDCDDGVLALADGLNWSKELKDLVKSEHARLDIKEAKEKEEEKKKSNESKASSEEETEKLKKTAKKS